jgi:hypothetical protein
MHSRIVVLFALITGLGAAHCGGKDTGSGSVPGTGAGDAQTPPTGESAVEAWLDEGHYKTWHCEPAPHDARPGSAHGKNRICSNELLSAHGAGEFPVGAASVKELYDATSTNIIGRAVYLHVSPGAGESYYWYERVSDHLNADGLGTSGTPRDTCVGCHQGAGPKSMGHDLVFTQVR